MSKISVIIPCYNAEKYIKKCFEGLEKQTFREFDVIVVDDFSTDNSLNILYEIKQNSKLKIKVIKMKQNVKLLLLFQLTHVLQKLTSGLRILLTLYKDLPR